MSEDLQIGSEVAAVLRPEEAEQLRDLRDRERVRCVVCGGWIHPGSDGEVSISIALEAGAAMALYAHGRCASSHADLAALVTVAEANPLGIAYAQAMHPEAGAVLLWERNLDVRARGHEDRETYPYLEAQRFDGFHHALYDEPVHDLPGLRLALHGPDLLLLRGDDMRERFHAAADAAPPGWMEALEASGFCLMIVGAQLELGEPTTAGIQQAIRAGRALMGLVEYVDG